MASSSSNQFCLKPIICYCGRIATRYVTKTPKNGNQGRAFFVCPSRWENGARRRCNYFQFEDEQDDDVTSMDFEVSMITNKLDDHDKRISDLENRLKRLEKLLKLAFVIILLFIAKCCL